MAASKKVVLTDRFLKALKPAPKGKREIVWDAIQPHLAVRVTDKGLRTFVVVKRLAGDPRPTRHFLGSYPVLSLADARTAAPKILSAFLNGDDPKELERERLQEAKLKQGERFEVVAQDFMIRHVAKLKSHRSTELIIKRELLGISLKRKRENGKWVEEWTPTADPRLRERPIAKITRRDVVGLLEKISDAGSRYQARKVFAILSKLFNWAVLRDTYGLESNPVARLRYVDLLGTFAPRSRVLADDELRRVWGAAEQVGYPFGSLVQMLMLTGQRLRELSNSRWSEISEKKDILVIPADRMKAKAAHSVPLTAEARALLAKVPRFNGQGFTEVGAFIFSTTCGRRPLSGFSKMKERLEKNIKRTADEARNQCNGDMPHWTLHDLRRTVRTRLSGLGVLPLVAELVIGHKQTGVQAVYDLHTYDREKRAALERWQNQLLTIVDGSTEPSNNVVAMRVLNGGRRIDNCAS